MTDDQAVEKMARQIIRNFGGDPDQLVQPGAPKVYGTPTCDVTEVSPEKAEPLWRFYIGAARSMLTIARQVIADQSRETTEAAA